MKTISRREKFLSQEEFFKLYNRFIRESINGQRLQKNGQRIRMSTCDKYISTQKLLTKFCSETDFEIKLFLANNLKGKELMAVKKYWKQFYHAFTSFLYSEGKFDNYVGSVIKNLRLFFNYLSNERLLPIGNFYKTFYVPKEEIPIVVLSPSQLNYLIFDNELNQKLSTDLQIIKDIFVFGCTVALRISDLMLLKPFHLVRNESGSYLKVRSKKTSTGTIVKLPVYAIDILKKYEGKQSTLLPKMSTWYFNKQLKRLAIHITDEEPMIKVRLKKGIPSVIYKNKKARQHYTMADHLSSHTMRRTAITTMLRLNMPEQLVRMISGHAAGSKEFYRYVSFSQNYLDTETDKMFDKLVEMR